MYIYIYINTCICIYIYIYIYIYTHTRVCVCILASQMALMVENLAANRRLRDAGLIPGLGRSPGGRHGNLLQYSCLENPMDSGAWWTTIHRVGKSETRLTEQN